LVISMLHENRIRYAVVGGLARAMYGGIREKSGLIY